MTSNIGSQWIQELGESQREEMERRITDALRAAFKPEFLNRIDETIIFHNLTSAEIREIVKLQILRLEKRLADRRITLEVTESAQNMIVEKGYDPIYGARPLKRAIQKYLENPLSMEILKGRIPDGSSIHAQADNDQLVFHCD